MAETSERLVETSHGKVAVELTRSRGPDVVLIHGNSFCREVFHRQIHSDLAERYRLIAVDLPGHGRSDDAREKSRTYPIVGLAEAVAETLDELGVRDPVLLGWSLGGAVAIEMLAKGTGCRGLFITGAPPVGDNISEGFKGNLLQTVATRGPFLPPDAAEYVRHVFGLDAEKRFEEAALRTDKDFRPILFSSERRTERSDQREVVARSAVPIAVVNGADDPVINLDYIDGLPFSNLWNRKCLRLQGSGHAPFLQNAASFNWLLGDFLKDLDAAA